MKNCNKLYIIFFACPFLVDVYGLGAARMPLFFNFHKGLLKLKIAALPNSYEQFYWKLQIKLVVSKMANQTGTK